MKYWLMGITVSIIFLVVFAISNKPSSEKINMHKIVDINGVKQFLDIRGDNADLPVLLILHGGPGTPETAFFNYFNANLEQDFIVVNWEQRGAGISLLKQKPPKESMNVAQFVQDTKSVTDLLKREFNQEKIYLLGHSWGSQLGLFTVQKYPNDYYAYIGTGQVSHTQKSEEAVFQLVYQWAKADNNDVAIKELQGISTAPYKSYDYNDIDKLEMHRKWASYYGGGPVNMLKHDTEAGKNPMAFLGKIIDSAEAYKKYHITVQEFYAGQGFIPEKFFSEVNDLNPMDKVKQVELPVYFLQGVDDAQTSYKVAKEYFDLLKAPTKKFYTFEHSSHSPAFEEAEKFRQVMQEIVQANDE